MRTLSSLAASITLAILVACGGSDTVQGPGEEGEAQVLDFSAIVGTWSGWAVEPRDGSQDIDFWARFELGGSAAVGSRVGIIEEGLVRGETDCVADAVGVDIEGNVYTVEELVTSGPCPDAIVRLEHDPIGETLTVHWSVITNPDRTASGTMTRGSDPGPKP